MKAELLSKLSLRTQSFEKGSVHHGAVTPEDINIMLGYSDLDKKEYSFLMMKFVNDTSARDDLFYELYDDVIGFLINKKLTKGKWIIRKLINMAILESCIDKCMFCSGTGFIKTETSMDKCPHCHKGAFLWNDDQVRSELLGMKKQDFTKYKKQYEQILNKIAEIELSALQKIGDT